MNACSITFLRPKGADIILGWLNKQETRDKNILYTSMCFPKGVWAVAGLAAGLVAGLLSAGLPGSLLTGPKALPKAAEEDPLGV